MRGEVLIQEEAVLLDSQECLDNQTLYAVGKRRHKADLPCVQLHGPLLQVVTFFPSNHHPLGVGHNYHWPLSLAWLSCCVPVLLVFV